MNVITNCSRKTEIITGSSQKHTTLIYTFMAANRHQFTTHYQPPVYHNRSKQQMCVWWTIYFEGEQHHLCFCMLIFDHRTARKDNSSEALRSRLAHSLDYNICDDCTVCMISHQATNTKHTNTHTLKLSHLYVNSMHIFSRKCPQFHIDVVCQTQYIIK